MARRSANSRCLPSVLAKAVKPYSPGCRWADNGQRGGGRGTKSCPDQLQVIGKQGSELQLITLITVITGYRGQLQVMVNCTLARAYTLLFIERKTHQPSPSAGGLMPWVCVRRALNGPVPTERCLVPPAALRHNSSRHTRRCAPGVDPSPQSRRDRVLTLALLRLCCAVLPRGRGRRRRTRRGLIRGRPHPYPPHRPPAAPPRRCPA